MKTEFKSIIRNACHSFGGAVCAGAILLIAASAPGQNLFVTDWSSGWIYSFEPNGAHSNFASGLLGPEGMAFDSAGNLFVATDGVGAGAGSAIIYDYTPGGARSAFATGLNHPQGLAFDGAGNLFEADHGSGNIYEFTPGYVNTETPITFASGVSPVGLAFNSAGDLFAADELTGDIYEFTPGGAKSTFATGLNNPQGLAFDSAGNLFEADWGSGNIYEFTPGGVRSTFASGLSVPVGLAFNSAGDLFATDHLNPGKIYEFTPGYMNGETPITFVFNLNGPNYLAFQGITLPVPEPAVFGLLAVGVTALIVHRRRASIC